MIQLGFTLVIIAVTVLTSIAAFNNDDLRNKLMLYPYGMDSRPSEYYRMLSAGFIHQDIPHLFFNMYALYIFGDYMEAQFGAISFTGLYLVLYLSGIVIANVPAMIKHRNHSYYRALGASGGVSAVLFAYIYFEPWSRIGILFIPVGIPALLFAVLYLAYSAYASNRGRDNIGHDAHFLGGVYGFVFAFLFDPTHGRMFLEQIQNFR